MTSNPTNSRGLFRGFLRILPAALLALLLAFDLAGRCYYASWAEAISSRAERCNRASMRSTTG